MPHRNGIKLVGPRARDYLVFKSHEHQVVEFVHGGLRELHDAAVRELLENGSCGGAVVAPLRRKELRNEVCMEESPSHLFEDTF